MELTLPMHRIALGLRYTSSYSPLHAHTLPPFQVSKPPDVHDAITNAKKYLEHNLFALSLRRSPGLETKHLVLLFILLSKVGAFLFFAIMSRSPGLQL